MIGDNWRKWNYCGTKPGTGKLSGWVYNVDLRTLTNDWGISVLCHDGKGRANYAMSDGHVEAMNGLKLVEGAATTTNYTGIMMDHRN